jgi:hypothetical protein
MGWRRAMTTHKSTGPFRVPRDGFHYYQEIVDRCHRFINCGIWEGLDKLRLRAWLANFKTDEEKYFSACVLDALIYRSEKQTVSLLRHLFQRILPDLARSEPGHHGALDDAYAKLRRVEFPSEPGMRLVSVMRSSDPHSKSSPTLLRHLKRHLLIDERWMIKPSDMAACLNNGVEVFIFVDDFLGTGDQFKELVQSEYLTPLVSSAYTAYCPLAAHQEGVSALNTFLPDLRIRSVEPLDERHELFHPSASCFDDGLNDPMAAKSFYYALLHQRGVDLTGCERRGYGGLAARG